MNARTVIRRAHAAGAKQAARERALDEARNGFVPPALADAIRKRHRRAKRNLAIRDAAAR
jgi:hypothetical protein